MGASEGVALTSGERKAYRLGVLRGLELSRTEVDERLFDLKVRVAGAAVFDADPPKCWPVLKPSIPTKKRKV